MLNRRCTIAFLTVLTALTAIPARGQDAPRAVLTEASLWAYKSLCDVPVPTQLATELRIAQNTSVTVTGCGDLEKQWGTPVAVRLHFTNGADKPGEVALKGLEAVTVSGKDKGSALGLQFRHPSPFGGGFSVDIMNQLKGEITYVVPAKGAVDLVVIFKSAALGDAVSVGGGTPVKIAK